MALVAAPRGDALWIKLIPAEGKYFVDDSGFCHRVVSATPEATRCGVEGRMTKAGDRRANR